MFTLFACPKPFKGHDRIIQINAIKSWMLLKPRPEIILFEAEESIQEIAKELGVDTVYKAECNEYGTPLANHLFKKVDSVAKNSTICYVNSDIILMNDFTKAIDRAKDQKEKFLLIGHRHDVKLNVLWDFEKEDWQQRLRDYIKEKGAPYALKGIDYFVYSKKLFSDIPPLALGRTIWDNWLIYHACSSKIPVIDATKVVTAIHQSHNYNHCIGGEYSAWRGKEAKQNLLLAGGLQNKFNLMDATHILEKDALKPASDIKHNAIRLYRSMRNNRLLYLLYKFITYLIEVSRPIRLKIDLIFNIKYFIDMVLVLSAWLLSYWLRFLINPIFRVPIGEFVNYIYPLPAIVITWPIICTYFELYKLKSGLEAVSQMADMLKAVFASFMVVITVSFAFPGLGLARSFIFIWTAINLLLLAISRTILKRTKLILEKEKSFKNVLVIGEGEEANRVEEDLKKKAESYNLVGVIKDSESGTKRILLNGKIIGEFENVASAIKSSDVEEIIIAGNDMDLSQKLDLAVKYVDVGIAAKVVSGQLYPFTKNIKLGQLGTTPIFQASHRGPNVFYGIFKEILDKIVAFCGIACSLWLSALIALVIKLDSPGSAIFSQIRIGKDEKEFRIYKFRTMFSDAAQNSHAPVDDKDPRVTRIGRFLRRWSLDELPQLFNVLKGDMSIVGPRPDMPFIVKDYKPWQRKRLEVKPGITGLWQVVGRKDIPLHENIEYDFYYLNNRSLVLDFIISFKSIPAVIRKRGAY